MRLSVLFSLQSRAVLQVATGSYYEHDLRHFHAIHKKLQSNDILVYDRADRHFVLAAQLRQKNVDLISRVPHRKIEWRSGKRLGKHDRLVVWKMGSQNPPYLTQEQWAALPEEITVRVLKVRIYGTSQIAQKTTASLGRSTANAVGRFGPAAPEATRTPLRQTPPKTLSQTQQASSSIS